MKHTVSDLLTTVYHHYPRRLQCGEPRYQKRGVPAAADRSPARHQHPSYDVQNQSYHLASGSLDACEPMPPEVGTVIVGDVTTSGRQLWQARIYDCLMSDDW